MNRRNALTLIALSAAAPTVALAQEKRQLGDTAQKYMRDTLEVGGVALATSLIAKERARDGWVKKFAIYEADEQKGVADVLQSLGGQPPSDEATERQQAIQKLHDLQGERFEIAFLDAQHDGHRRLASIQEEFIGKGQDRDLQNMARLILGRVEEHLDLIQTIRQELHAQGNRGQAGRPG